MLTERGEGREAGHGSSGQKWEGTRRWLRKGQGLRWGQLLMPPVSIYLDFAGVYGTVPTWVGREEQGGGLRLPGPWEPSE